MALAPELIEIFACPKCKGKLTERDDPAGHAFVCPACKLRYAVENDLPNFLIEEATPVA